MEPSFRLKRLLRLREQLRALRAHEAGALEHEMRSLERGVVAARDGQRVVADDEQRAAASGALTPDGLQLGRGYANALADAEQAYRRAMRDTGRSLEAKRGELVESHREESKVRRLEEVHRERVHVEQSRAAAQSMDELAIDRYERTRRQR